MILPARDRRSKGKIMLGVVYLALAIVVGLAGRKRHIGFVGYALLSIILTPIPPLLFLLLTQKRFLEHDAAMRMNRACCRGCGQGLSAAAASRYCHHCGAPL